MTIDDELLDKILDHLRNEPIPEMPPELVHDRRVPPQVRTNANGRAIAAGVLAIAVLLGGLLLWYSSGQPSPGPAITRTSPATAQSLEPEVAIVEVNVAVPLTDLESKLDELDIQIRRLRRDAELLAARRKVEELLAQY